MTDPEANRKLIQQYWDAFNRSDMLAASEFFAEDIRNYGRPVGRQRVLAVHQDIQATLPDIPFTPLHYVAEGEWVAVRAAPSAGLALALVTSR